MKTKLFITIVAIIYAIAVASAVAGIEVDNTLEIAYCDIYSDWDEAMC